MRLIKGVTRYRSYRGWHGNDSNNPRNIPLFNLPNEITLLIAQYLTPKSLNSFLQANRYLAFLLASPLQRFALQSKYSETALWFAAATGQKELIRRILENVPQILVKEAVMGAMGHMIPGSVLHKSPARCDDWLVKLLVQGNRNIIIHDTRCGGTPLHWASQYGHESIVRSLLAGRINITITDGRGRTALHWAAKAGHEDVVKILLKYGAFVDSQDNYGDTALHRATEQSHEGVVRVLLENGADVAIPEGDGATVLHWAAAYGKDAIALLLLENGAETKVFGRNGETPLHQAAAHGHCGVAKLLMKFGADVEALDEFGWTPLHHAVANHHEPVAVLLESRGEVSSRDRKRRRAAIVKAIRGMNMRAVRWFLSRIRVRS